MSHQLNFVDCELSSKHHQTQQEIFLSRMERLPPWQKMLGLIEPPTAGNGRSFYPFKTVLGIHYMRSWYIDALYEIASMRHFANQPLDQTIPVRTTIINFRHQLASELFDTIDQWLPGAEAMMMQGTLVDATIVEAPSAAKNNQQQRAPVMHQTKKGNRWHFGRKAHIVVDAKSGLRHKRMTTAANEHDLNLLHGDEEFILGDVGFRRAEKRPPISDVICANQSGWSEPDDKSVGKIREYLWI